MPEIFDQINWLDLFFIILLVGTIYRGLKTGVGGQVLSLVGRFVLIFISIGYYGYVAASAFGFLQKKWAEPVAFLVLSMGIYLVVRTLDRLFNATVADDLSPIERIGGAVLASFRSFIFFGVIGIFLLLTPVPSLREAVTERSVSSMLFVKMDAEIYDWISGITGIKGEDHENNIVNFIINDDIGGVPANETEGNLSESS